MASDSTSTPRFAYKADRLKPLRAFCQVARLGSVSRAAVALYVSQPAITLQLQALERELGVRLFERVGRRLTPTREGDALYELARPLVEGLDSLPAAFREQIKGLDAGELHVAAGSSTILYLLPKIVEAYRQAHPQVRLILHNVTGAGGLDLLRSDGVDLAVGSMLDAPSDLDYAPVYRFEPMLITPPDHPLVVEARAQARRPLALWLDPAAAATHHVSTRRPGVPTKPRALYRRPRSRRLGSHQTIRRDGLRHQHRHLDLPHRRRPHPPRRTIAGEILPLAQLRRGDA